MTVTRIRAGDIVVCGCEPNLTDHALDELTMSWKANLPDGVRVIVTAGLQGVTVLRPEGPDREPGFA